MASQDMFGRNEPFPDLCCRLWNHALAIRVYRPRNQAVPICILGWVSCSRRWEDPQLAASRAIRIVVRACFSSKVQRICAMASDCLLDLRPTLGPVAVTARAVVHNRGSSCADLLRRLLGAEFLLGPARRRRKQFSPLAD